jgi:signal transduction histidine kinase
MLLAAAVAAAADTVRPAIESRGQSLELSLPGRPLRLSADPVRIAQVLENLLANASKYTPARGAIRVEAHASRGWIELRVIDSGIGIAAADLERVFEPFVQLDATLDRAQGGLGIGLALVRQLAELHGGSVRAESAGPRRGSCFVLRLPEAEAPTRGRSRDGRAAAGQAATASLSRRSRPSA